jgi:hypothetical protein
MVNSFPGMVIQITYFVPMFFRAVVTLINLVFDYRLTRLMTEEGIIICGKSIWKFANQSLILFDSNIFRQDTFLA